MRPVARGNKQDEVIHCGGYFQYGGTQRGTISGIIGLVDGDGSSTAPVVSGGSAPRPRSLVAIPAQYVDLALTVNSAPWSASDSSIPLRNFHSNRFDKMALDVARSRDHAINAIALPPDTRHRIRDLFWSMPFA